MIAQVNSAHNYANTFDRQLKSAPIGGVQVKLFYDGTTHEIK